MLLLATMQTQWNALSWFSFSLFILISVFCHCFISGYDANARLIEEEDSACPTLLEQDFNRFQHTIPGLRRSGVDANAIRQVNKLTNRGLGKLNQTRDFLLHRWSWNGINFKANFNEFLFSTNFSLVAALLSWWR